MPNPRPSTSTYVGLPLVVSLLLLSVDPTAARADEPSSASRNEAADVAAVVLASVGLGAAATGTAMGFVADDHLTDAIADPTNGCPVHGDRFACRHPAPVQSARTLEYAAAGIGLTGGAACLATFIIVVATPETKPRQRAWVLPAIDPIGRQAALSVTVSF